MNDKNELVTSVQFNDLRLPYNEALADLGIDNIGWKVLQDTIFPNAQSASSIIMAITYCKRRNLDIFKKPVHIVPMWSSAAKKMIDTVWPGIGELRTTAHRTGSYAGHDPTEFGDWIEEEFTGLNADKNRVTRRVRYPEWVRMTVYRFVQSQSCAFPGPKVYWKEAYAHASRDSDLPNEMWSKRPVGQLEKCAEAAALRAAFPEEIGNELTAEEMAGQVLYDAGAAVESPEPGSVPRATDRPGPPPPAIQSNATAPMEPVGNASEPDVIDVEAREVIDEPKAAPARPGPPPPAASRPGPPPPAKAAPSAPAEAKADPDAMPRPEDMRKKLVTALAAATDGDSLSMAWELVVGPWEDQLFPPDHEDLLSLYRRREKELEQ